MVRLSEVIGKQDEHVADRIKVGRNIRFIDTSTCPEDVKEFLAEARYWFGRGEHVSEAGVRRRLDVQLLDYRVVNGTVVAIVQVNRDKKEAWQRFTNRRLVYHLAACPSGNPTEISDSPILVVKGQGLHWYVRHDRSPLSSLASRDPALFGKVLSPFPHLSQFVQSEIKAASSEWRAA
jgi:hypothetical protein